MPHADYRKKTRRSGKTPSERIAPRLVAVLAPFAAWVFLFPAYLSSGNRISPDSASYIECAQSIRAGEGFRVRLFGTLAPQLWVPLDCFPPGYPLLTAGLMCLGVDDAYTAAKTVAAGCSCVFVLLVLAILRKGVAALNRGPAGDGVRLHRADARV